MFIALVGTDGAGKSLQAERLRSVLENAGRSVGSFDMWSATKPSVHQECRFITGGRPLVRVCIAEMEGPSRALFLFWMMMLAADRTFSNAESDVFIADGYWQKHAAAELVYGCPKTIIDGVCSAFRKPDLVLFLDVSPEVALSRKGKKGLTPYECARDPSMPPERFISHQTLVREVLKQWAAENRWHVVDANRSADEVSAEIEAIAISGLRDS